MGQGSLQNLQGALAGQTLPPRLAAVQGQQGIPGPMGPEGKEGQPGARGDIGPIGPIGPPGPEGPRGPQGMTGPMGLTGTMGAMGLMGFTGTMGPMGLPGAQGPRGDIGPIGPPGKDSSPIAVADTLVQDPYLSIVLSTLTDKSKPYYNQLRGDTGLPGKDSQPTDVAKNLISSNDFLNNLAGTITNPTNPYYKQLIGTMGPIGLKGDTGAQGPKGDSPSATAVAQGLMGLGNAFINNLGKTIVSSSIGVDFANNVANSMTATAANQLASLLYNQINDSVGNSFLSNVEYKLVNNNNFTLSLADSLTNSTVGNKLSQLVYNQINTNTSANSVLSSLNSNLQKNNVFVDNVVNTMTTNSTFGNNLTDLIYNKINNTPTSGNTIISKLAYNLATNPDYQYILQGPPGDILDPISLQKSMQPKTLWCSNGTFGNNGNSTLCNIPNQPTFNTTSNTYTSNTSIIQVGDWQIYQSTDGNLQFVNKNNKIPNASIFTPHTIQSSKALLAGPESMTSNVLGGPNTTVIQPSVISVDNIRANQSNNNPITIGDGNRQTVINGGPNGPNGGARSNWGQGVYIPTLIANNIYPTGDSDVNIYRFNSGSWLRLRAVADFSRSLDQNGERITAWSNNNGPNQQWFISRS
jgi:Collagen triple helix repeat (20 copies)